MEQLLEYIRYFAFTILGGGAGYFIRLFIEHRLAIDRIKENIRITEFNKAAAVLRAAFAPAIAKFNILSDMNEINEMLKQELIPQSVAIEKFRPFVGEKNRDKYQETWENYHETHKREGVSSVDFLSYAMGDEKKRFSLFKKNINEVLKFTEK